MATRLDVTTATGDSAPFDPGGEVILQLDAASAGAKVAVLVRVDTSAEWVQIGELSSPLNRFVRLAAFPQVMLRIVNNVAGQAIKVRSSV